MKAAAPDVRPPSFVSERLAKALSNSLRVQILIAVNHRDLSVTQFVKANPQYSHSQVYGHFRKLEAFECIEEVKSKTGGRRWGGVERFYRATALSLFDETNWASLPASLKKTITGAVMTTYINQVVMAIDAGTIDVRPDRHFTWSGPQFDQRAWDETIEEVEELSHAFRYGRPKRQCG